MLFIKNKRNQRAKLTLLSILCSCCESLSEEARETEKEADFRSLSGYSHNLAAKDQNPSKCY